MWQLFLEKGSPELKEELLRNFSKWMLGPSLADAGLARAARVALRQAFILATSNLLAKTDSGLPTAFIQRLVRSEVLTLLPPQYHLLVDKRIATRRENILLNLPTSTGKTLIAESSIVSALAHDAGVAVVVVPYVAIGNQTFDALKRHVPIGIRVHKMFGGYSLEERLRPDTANEVIVSTPERFDGWLRQGNFLSQLRCVVFDELHNIENGARGTRLEGLITRLRILQGRGASFQILAMSAVLAHPEMVCQWLGVANENLYRETWRPTARHLALWRPSGKLVWIYGNDPLRPKARHANEVSAAKALEWPRPMYVSTTPYATAEQQNSAHENVAYLARYAAKSIGKPVLIVCGTKATTRAIAKIVADSVADDPELETRRAAIIGKAKELAPWFKLLPAFLAKGVAYHNATVPSPLRKELEDSVRRGELDFVVSTTTLAEGADLPFRVTILDHWLVGFGEQARPLPALMFRNIVGRCGRAGAYSEGDTIIFENLIGPRPLTADQNRSRYLTHVIADPPMLESAMFSQNSVHKPEEQEAMYATLSSQVIAAIPESPDDSELASTIARNSYAASTGHVVDMTKYCEEIVDTLLSANDGEPFAVAASPLRLTEFGSAANRSGFSPNTCRAVLELLQCPKNDRDVHAFLARILSTFCTVPEQTDMYLRKVFLNKKQRGFVKAGDFVTIIAGWAAQKELYDIFVSLPTFERSSANDNTREKEFDKFVQLAESAVGNFLPWFLRACAQLSSFGSPWAKSFDWSGLAEMLEKRASLEDFGVAFEGDA
ncbi:MAG TPA: DEAD/DEAH box helicase [Candidatus Binatia bacterium]|nr:DEAD/DEAH box helicase [Candidatus Binatia bacterium]